MQLLSEAEAFAPSGAVVSIGMFDGVHRGHRAVLAQLRARGDALGLPTVVVTFDPHPRAVVTPHRAPPLLGSVGQRLALLAASGAADACLVIRFDRARSAQPVDAFVEQTLLGGLGMRALVVGENFACGHQRKGDVAYLVQSGLRHGFTVNPVALRQAAEAGSDAPCSSTYARQLVSAGDVELAGAVLGRPYELAGNVMAGPAGHALAVRLPQGICTPAPDDYDGAVAQAGDDTWMPAVLQVRAGECDVRLHTREPARLAEGSRIVLRFTARRLRAAAA
ncbi:FAD synthetase family protein [Cupriavidus necator]|uniref:FAD synthetase family protein n=1 Tax=Cupriavidus necator TaxID=106590 RepID=UPI00068A1152|nr:FAD synthetase family protein [Cupriavidus necator]